RAGVLGLAEIEQRRIDERLESRESWTVGCHHKGALSFEGGAWRGPGMAARHWNATILAAQGCGTTQPKHLYCTPPAGYAVSVALLWCFSASGYDVAIPVASLCSACMMRS